MSIVYLFKFTDEATAQADPVVGLWWTPPRTVRGHAVPGMWAGDVIAPTDVTHNDGDPATPYEGFWMQKIIESQDQELDTHSAMQVCWNDTIYGMDSVIINNIGSLTDYCVSPIAQGSTGPWANSAPLP